MIDIRTIAGAAVLAVLVASGTGCAGTETRENAEQYAGDSAVTARVKTALGREDTASLLDIEVETVQGITQLSGFVDTELEKLRAGEVAEAVEGVTRVENSLIVKPAS